ncbi:tetratricopeptide repeat protein [Polluticoccus soli]
MEQNRSIDKTSLGQQLDSTFKKDRHFISSVDESIYYVLTTNHNLQSQPGNDPATTNYFPQAFELLEPYGKQNNIYLWVTVNAAWYAYSTRNMQDALQYYSEAIRVLQQIPPDAVIDPVNTYKWIGYFLGTIDEKKIAIDYLKKALSSVNNPETNKLQSTLYDNIGVYYGLLGNHQEALTYLDSAFQFAGKNNDSLRIAKVYGNQARIFTAEKMYDTAIQLLLKDVAITQDLKDSQNLMFAYHRLADAYLGEQNATKSNIYLDKAIAIAAPKAYLQSDEFDLLRKKLQLVRQYRLYVDTTAILLRMNAIRDIIDTTDGANAINMARLGFINNLHALQGSKIAVSLNEERMTKRVYAIIVLLLLTVILLVIITHRKKLSIKEKSFEVMLQKLEDEKRQSEEKLIQAHHDVSSYLTFLNERNQQITALKEELEKRLPNENQTATIKNLLTTNLITEENWLSFKLAFIHENNHFYQKLTSEHPDLTESNLRIIFLSKLGLSNQETANVLGVTYDAVKKAKQRLKVKLGADLSQLFS